MARYLLSFSYVGTGFSGLQQQNTIKSVKTVLGVIEEILSTWVDTSNDVHVISSSRTDRGVHALCNTAHVDLIHRKEGHVYCPNVITMAVNQALMLMKAPLRILRTQRVSDDFHCRFNAYARTYVYRIAVSRMASLPFLLPCTPFEYQRIYTLMDPIDMNKVKDTADLLSGTHDFSSFTTPRMLKENPWKNPVKNMAIKVQRSEIFMHDHLSSYDDYFENWDLLFHGGSFLYKQVRKMSAVMLAVGSGQLQLEEARMMLEHPGEVQIVKTNIMKIPPYALYLKEVHYQEKDLQPPENDCIVDEQLIPVFVQKIPKLQARRMRRLQLEVPQPPAAFKTRKITGRSEACQDVEGVNKTNSNNRTDPDTER